jgi:hypothetical protein
MAQTSIAADLARVAGLALVGDVGAIRAEQAKIEAARLRFRHGKDAPVAAVTRSSVIRSERANTAKAIAAAARLELRKSLDELFGDGPSPEPGPSDDLKEGFVVEGRVLRGTEGVAGVAVEALTTTKPETTAAGATSDRAGAFRLVIENVVKLRQKLGLDEKARLSVVVVARSGKEIVAQVDGDIAVKAGGRSSVTLRVTVPRRPSKRSTESSPRPRKS